MKKYEVYVDDGSKEWYLDGKQHREDGPAVEYANGYKAWYLNGKLHREDGPAVEYANGTKYWYLDGKLHREDGPAVERVNGSKEWYLDGKKVTESDFLLLTSEVKAKELTVAEVEKLLGYSVKIVK